MREEESMMPRRELIYFIKESTSTLSAVDLDVV